MTSLRLLPAALAALLLLLAGCQDSSPLEEEPAASAPRPIGMTPTLTEATRAPGDGELTDELLRQRGFGVYCWYTGKEAFTTALKSQYMLMQNQAVGYDEEADRWGYAPTKYWPLDESEMLTFRAYAPYREKALPTDADGMPVLPVSVGELDFHNGTQQDPLWGTGRLSTTNSRYGSLYTDVTYAQSGLLPTADAADGTLQWFFHHGMAKLYFKMRLEGVDELTFKTLSVEPLYSKGNLSLSSPAGSASQKPEWTDCGGKIDVVFTPTELTEAVRAYDTSWPNFTDIDIFGGKGLLMVPRDYRIGDPLTVTLSYHYRSFDTATSTYKEDDETITAHLSVPIWGNTAYTVVLTLSHGEEPNSLKMMLLTNQQWQSGSYFAVTDL